MREQDLTLEILMENIVKAAKEHKNYFKDLASYAVVFNCVKGTLNFSRLIAEGLQLPNIFEALGVVRFGLHSAFFEELCSLEEIKTKLAEHFGYSELFAMFIDFRKRYRWGVPAVSDGVYDTIFDWFKHVDSIEELVLRSYDDDEENVSISGLTGEIYASMNEEKSRSISPITTYAELWQFLQDNKGMNFVASLKMNGVFTKTLYRDGQYVCTLSRGRTGDSIDFTEKAQKRLVKNISMSERDVVVYGEAWVEESYLPVLRKKYDLSAYKTSRSSALSLLRARADDSDIQHLHITAFSVNDFGRSGECYTFLEENKFSTAPWFRISAKDVPDRYENLMRWARDTIFNPMSELGAGIPSDGIVLESETDEITVSGQYASNNIALKMEQWSYRYYLGRVTKIIPEQRRVTGSLRVEIEPLVLSDGQTAKMINVFNPNILFENNIRVGSEVYFERSSEAYSVLLIGDRLRAAVEGRS
jgi:NAD-dependent DNA ligase